jgi:predicted adenylyl cyclase CyaB
MVMEEIEILVRLNETKEKALTKLGKYKFKGEKEVLDIYYYDPKRSELKPNSQGVLKECFRLRKKGEKSYVTYKIDHFEGKKWSHSDEHETEIENLEIFEKIVKHLGLKELIRVDNRKMIFDSENFEIVLEHVKNLGLFMEVENKHLKGDIDGIKKEILNFIKNLGIKFTELNSGKPELMLKKTKKTIFS